MVAPKVVITSRTTRGNVGSVPSSTSLASGTVLFFSLFLFFFCLLLVCHVVICLLLLFSNVLLFSIHIWFHAGDAGEVANTNSSVGNALLPSTPSKKGTPSKAGTKSSPRQRVMSTKAALAVPEASAVGTKVGSAKPTSLAMDGEDSGEGEDSTPEKAVVPEEAASAAEGGEADEEEEAEKEKEEGGVDGGYKSVYPNKKRFKPLCFKHAPFKPCHKLTAEQLVAKHEQAAVDDITEEEAFGTSFVDVVKLTSHSLVKEVACFISKYSTLFSFPV